MMSSWQGMTLGVAAGLLWNVVNLWCLAYLLRLWIGEGASKRQVAMWAVVKFPLLYAAAFVLLRHPAVSVVGFGLGFTVVLLLAGLWTLLSARRLAPHHG